MNAQQISAFWTYLAQVWGAKFFEQYGEKANDAWSAMLSKISPEQAKWALQKLIDGGSPFAPTLPEFYALARTHKPMRAEILDYKRPEMTKEQHDVRRAEMYTALGLKVVNDD